MISKHRLEALSDGIFAIVMTLLILELKVPGEASGGHLAQALAQNKTEWASFLLTFAIAARFWVLQHNVCAALEKVEAETTALTFAFLCLVTVLPFTTSLLGRFGGDRLSFFLYALNAFALSILLLVQFELARYRGHLNSSAESTPLRHKLYTFLVPMLVALLTALTLPLHFSMGATAVSAFIARRLNDAWLKRLIARRSLNPS